MIAGQSHPHRCGPGVGGARLGAQVGRLRRGCEGGVKAVADRVADVERYLLKGKKHAHESARMRTNVRAFPQSGGHRALGRADMQAARASWGPARNLGSLSPDQRDLLGGKSVVVHPSYPVMQGTLSSPHRVSARSSA